MDVVRGTPLRDLDTPAMLIDLDVMERNMRGMQKKADAAGVKLRPHTKTHRTPAIALLQEAAGAVGVTVAKLGEAEVMAAEGLKDIFIANEIVGAVKLERLRRLARGLPRLAVGADSPVHALMLSSAMAGESKPIDVLVDVNTGDPRTGIAPGKPTVELAQFVTSLPGLRLRGIYTHDGQSYDVATADEVRAVNRESQRLMVETAELMRAEGLAVEEVSVGSTPSLLLDGVLPGVTEIRPGTYIFMDADQAQVVGTYEHCAQTVLATVISRPTPERVVLDAGTKALTYYVQTDGITRSPGHGRLKAHPEIFLDKKSDEHSSFDIPRGSGLVFEIGDLVEIIPNHACPTTNLYDVLYAVRDGRVETVWPVLCRGKSR